MRGNKKNNGLGSISIIGVFTVAVRRLVSRPSGQRARAPAENMLDHLTGVWENQEIWRRRLSM
jgi:hypothetical protein